MTELSRRSLVTLLTDFGLADPYVGILKGVIAQRAPGAHVVDLCHGIPPQDVVAGAFVLATSSAYFPAGTVHLAVVDPGVGSDRILLAVEADGSFFVGPDNGLLGGVIARATDARGVALELTQAGYPPISSTFHGRDVLAPAAARLANGEGLESLGPRATLTSETPWPEPDASPRGLCGQVIWIDQFGNAITNIPVPHGTVGGTVEVADVTSVPLVSHYAEAGVGEPLALRGGSGYLEVALRDGNAAQSLGIERGTKILWLTD